jgi:hypothetical protein
VSPRVDIVTYNLLVFCQYFDGRQFGSRHHDREQSCITLVDVVRNAIYVQIVICELTELVTK